MPHLIVGLGGTGGKVIAAFRRSVFRQFEHADTDELALDYLYIDSDAKDIETARNTTPLESNDKMWRVLGRSVQLSPSQTMLLKAANLDDIVKDVSEYPNLERWIGPRDVWDGIRAGHPNGITAAGQLRRFGRLLLAQNIGDVRKAVTGQMSQARGQAVDGNWTIHVVAGLAGGTGSGTLLDTVSLIRELPQGRNAKVIAYCVLPEGEETNWAKDNYYANGYAALAELNAILVGKSRLSNIAENAGNYTHDEFINNVLVATNKNDSNILIDMAEMVPNMVAETMYQLVVASGDARPLDGNNQGVVGGEARIWRSMVTGENYSGEYEGEPGEEPTRANRFLGFGIKRIAIPTEEIHDYAAGVLVRQFLLQATRMNWVDGEGYIEADRPMDATKIAREGKNQRKWVVTLDHLRLEEVMLNDDGPNWETIRSTILTPFNKVKDQLIENEKDTVWISKMEAFADSFYREKYRVVGLEEFYRVRERSIADRAKFIVRDRVASSLFDDWKSGELSLREIDKILSELLVDSQEKREKCSKLSDQADKAEKAALARRKENSNSYNGTGTLDKLTGRHKKIFSAHVEILADIYSNRGSRIANDFARKLLSSILTELNDLRDTVEAVTKAMDQAIEQTNMALKSRVKEDGSGESDQSNTTKLYDAGHIRSVMGRVQQDEATQKEITGEMRQSIIAQLGPSESFTAMRDKLPKGRMIAILEELAQVRADKLLAEQEAPQDRILETSIIQKLFDEYEGRDANLRQLIGNEVRKASSFAPRDPNQRMLQGAAEIEMVKVAFVPSRDKVPENLESFHDTLCDIIRNAAAGERVEIIQTSNNHQEIVFLSLANQFALRHLSGLEFLKKRYDKLLYDAKGNEKDNAARKRLELHLEGDGKDLPDLYPQSGDHIRKSIVGHFHLARLAGMLRESENERTGETEVVMLVEDDGGARKRLKIGQSLAERTDGVSRRDASVLKKAVERYIETKLELKRDRDALLEKATAFYNEAMDPLDYDTDSPKAAPIVAEYEAVRRLLT